MLKTILKWCAIAAAVSVVVVGAVVMFVPGIRSDSTPDCTPTTPPTELATFPYHPLVYHLDLSILSYHLYSQSLVWPLDPYYEERADRGDYMSNVRAWAGDVAAKQLADPDGIRDIRGPGLLAGFPDNPSHDPILYDYSGLHPWSSNIVNVEEKWTEYLTPDEITSRIRDVYVAYRPIGGTEDDVTIERVVPSRHEADPDASDVLIAFEGGTGNKGEEGQPHSQSLMGFVLARSRGDGGYDVHVTFRGSRSGSASRALWQALSTRNASGNPDWITDLGFRLIGERDGVGAITTEGTVARGFATSMQATLPRVFASLEMVADMNDAAPSNIYVTGHSLGGGLAQHFTSAVLLGDRYGPAGSGAAMPETLEAWPWTEIKLITYGAPRAGGESWAKPLTTEGLRSVFYDDSLIPYDWNALDSAAPEIVPRLTDPSQPVGYRVLISTDPITTDVFDASRGVGTTVYVNLVCGNGPVGIPDFAAHEPEAIRDFMLLATADDRTPATAWEYLDMTALNPDRNVAAKGTREEFDKLKDALLLYYAERDQWFDVEGFEADFDLMLSLE